VWSASYDALGSVETIGNETLQIPLRFQGQYYDPEIDLSYNRYRYYDHLTGSFVSQDPLGLAAGSNVYAYAPNTWGWIDPLGLSCKAKSLTRDSLIDGLLGKTQQGNRVAKGIKSGNISTNVLSDEMFEKAFKLKGGRGTAPQAFAYGEQIFVRKNSSNLLSDTLHEGTHALDYLNDFNGNVYQLEKRAYFYERQFQKAGGGILEHQTIDKMIGFIYANY
jgi:RHS repeat-associated protein